MVSNSYGFLVHPYLTLKRISRDKSQVAIFFTLWLGGWLGILFFWGIIALVLPHFFPHLVWLKNLSGQIGTIGTAFMLFFTFYLLFWVLKVFRTR